jgi:hypothetical protein
MAELDIARQDFESLIVEVRRAADRYDSEFGPPLDFVGPLIEPVLLLIRGLDASFEGCNEPPLVCLTLASVADRVGLYDLAAKWFCVGYARDPRLRSGAVFDKLAEAVTRVANEDLRRCFLKVDRDHTQLADIESTVAHSLSDWRRTQVLNRARGVAETRGIIFHVDGRSAGLHIYVRLRPSCTRHIRTHLALFFAQLAWIRRYNRGFVREPDNEVVFTEGTLNFPRLRNILQFHDQNEEQKYMSKNSLDVAVFARLRSTKDRRRVIYAMLIGQAEVPYPADTPYWLAFADKK